MARYGYVSGCYEDQLFIQRDILEESGLDFDGGITMGEPWADFIQKLECGDEVVVVARSRIASDPDERKARMEMLEIMEVSLRWLA